MAEKSALQGNKNTKYLKTDERINNKNSKTTRFDAAREDKSIIVICKKPNHTNKKCFYPSKAQEAVLNKKHNFFILANYALIILIVKNNENNNNN